MENAIPILGADGLIIEGLVTTYNPDFSINVAPMGPLVNSNFDIMVLRPFQNSTTYANLARTRHGIFHTVDDVELLAHAALGKVEDVCFLEEHPMVLSDACRWFEFQIASIDDSHNRSNMIARTVQSGRIREFVGFNRAKHAVVEAAIIATRLGILPQDGIAQELAALHTIVDKTGSAAEQRAFECVRQHVNNYLDSHRPVELSPK